ncbi:hypothetical protein LINPERHAP2_LOCUS42181 [Linum perenne]
MVAADRFTKSKADGGLGFKSFQGFNLAFLAKLAWQLLIQLDTLWARLLKCLYFPRKGFLKASQLYHPLRIWSGVMEGREILLKGSQKHWEWPAGVNFRALVTGC